MAAPVVDTVFTVLTAISALSVAAQDNVQNKGAVVGLDLAFAGLFLGSAYYGYAGTSECLEARLEDRGGYSSYPPPRPMAVPRRVSPPQQPVAPAPGSPPAQPISPPPAEEQPIVIPDTPPPARPQQQDGDEPPSPGRRRPPAPTPHPTNPG